MIESFGDRATEDVFHGIKSKQARKIPQPIWAVVRRKLDMLNVAQSPGELKSPPANQLQVLKGKPGGFYSTRVNVQYGIVIVFRFESGHASAVKCEDYLY